jgi:hypothetical protein
MPLGLLPVAVAAFALSAATACAAERIHKTLASPLVDEGTGPDGCEPELTGRGGPVKWEVRIERFLPDGKALVEVSRRRRRPLSALHRGSADREKCRSRT